jgi:solute carrier family 25 citrate transporter 1
MAAAQSPSSPFERIGRLLYIPQRFKTTARHTAKPKNSTPVLLFSSAIAGSVEAIATYPFEYAKTRVQLQTIPCPHHNPFSIIYDVTRYESVGTLYTGCSALVLGTAFKVSVRFASFSYFCRHLTDDHGSLTPARVVLAGFLAGLTESVVAVTPTERLKTILISNARNHVKLYRGESHAYEAVLRTQSLRGLYRGLVPTILKQSSTQGIKMGSYNVIRELTRRHELPQNGATALITGALAGTITVYITQPFDTIKTLAQSARGAGTIDAFRTVVRESGFTGLWSGSTSRLGRLAFSSSILYTVYEKVAVVMNGSLENQLLVYTQMPSAKC